MKKKGSSALIGTVIVAMIALLVIGLIAIFTYLINSQFFEEFNDTGFNNTATGKVEDSILGANLMLDWVIVLLLVIVIVGAMIVGYQNSSPPVFFVITFFAMVFLGAIGFIMSYMFKEIVTDSAFSSIINFFPNTIIIGTNLHWVGLMCLLAGSLVAYRNRGGGQPEI